METLRL